MLDILGYNVPSHPVSDRPNEIPVFPNLPAPKPLLQSGELAKQPPPTLALDYPDNLPYRPRGRKRYQKVDMFLHQFHLQNLYVVRLAYLPHHLFRSFPDLLPLKESLPVFRAPDHMIRRVVDRMTRPLQSHVPFISHRRARPYVDKGDFPVPLITPSARHAFLPVASHGATCKAFRVKCRFDPVLILRLPGRQEDAPYFLLKTR
jgi:hypothetical protein